MLNLNIESLRQDIRTYDGQRLAGKLRSAKGVLLSCTLPAAVGDHCEISVPGGRAIQAEIIGFADGVAHLVPYENSEEIHPGMPVIRKGPGLTVPMGEGLLGRILDGLGRPVDGRGPLFGCPERVVSLTAPKPMTRARVTQPLVTGQRAIDGLLTCGRGQRVGIFSGSGVGKSTLLGEIAKGSSADVNVIALIGERGPEVRPFLDDCLGPEGIKKSVLIVATCEQTPLMRVRGAQLAIAIADYFRQQGTHVLFMIDSLTRLGMAQRELGLALGEPPSARGYTPSVFQLLASVTEHLGNAEHGSITGIMTVLVDGGDLDEPISDAVRSLVDGHIVLDRRLAESGHFPAVSISQSISRVAHYVTDSAHQQLARKFREIMATYAEAEDLIRIGAYAKGTSPQIDKAIELRPSLLSFLRQEVNQRFAFDETRRTLERLVSGWHF